ncbi:MAG: hypothetical protein ACRDN0_10355 [Trebonia sp.]
MNEDGSEGTSLLSGLMKAVIGASSVSAFATGSPLTNKAMSTDWPGSRWLKWS